MLHITRKLPGIPCLSMITRAIPTLLWVSSVLINPRRSKRERLDSNPVGIPAVVPHRREKLLQPRGELHYDNRASNKTRSEQRRDREERKKNL